MSGTTTTTAATANHAATYNHAEISAKYIAATEYGSQIFNGKRGDYGLFNFDDPRRQATYEHHETRFKKKQDVKHAYNKHELLRRMRADIKREYLTRKKQIKKLQVDAAVDFRNAESSLQEHYATEAVADHCPYIHGVDINVPLASKIQLPNAQILDLKTFDEDLEFAKVCQIHADLLADQQESIRLFEQEEQRQSQYYTIQQGWMEREYGQRPYEPRGEEEEQPQQQEEEEVGHYGDGGFCGCGDLDCSDCLSYGGENDDKDSYDSDYCGPFGHLPREYNHERERREEEEAAAAAAAAAQAAEAAEQQRWEENTRDIDGETWDEEARANEAEHRREVALMKLNDDMTYTCDDRPDVQQLEVVAVMEPKQRITASAASSGGISAQKKAAAGAAKKAAKARQAKQELKKKAKFVPFKLTMNTNRVPVPVRNVEEGSGDDVEEEQTTTTTLLYQGRAQVNLPKKNLQNVSREGKKRHIAIWRRIETEEKHASARGTRIANIPEPMAWYNCGGSDIDNDYEC